MAPIHKAKIIATIVGQSRSDFSARGALEIKNIKSSPPYTGQLPRYKVVKEKPTTIDGRPVKLVLKAFPPENYVVEAVADLPDVFTPGVLAFKDKLIDQAEKMLMEQPIEKNFKEEFSFYCLRDFSGQPEQFLQHGQQIASLLKSESLPLSQAEIDKTLASSLQYGKDDLTVVDWDGAFIFDTDGDWQDTIDFLEVANIHLVRLRFLDDQLDRRLTKMATVFKSIPKFKTKELRETIRELLSLRTQSIIEFEHAERDIQLIGDWYAAQVYNLASRKLHLDTWRRTIREKLDSLEDITTMAAENFSVTAEAQAEQKQIILWFVLQFGWFTLLLVEFGLAFIR